MAWHGHAGVLGSTTVSHFSVTFVSSRGYVSHPPILQEGEPNPHPGHAARLGGREIRAGSLAAVVSLPPLCFVLTHRSMVFVLPPLHLMFGLLRWLLRFILALNRAKGERTVARSNLVAVWPCGDATLFTCTLHHGGITLVVTTVKQKRIAFYPEVFDASCWLLLLLRSPIYKTQKKRHVRTPSPFWWRFCQLRPGLEKTI